MHFRALKRVNELSRDFKKEVISEFKPSSPRAGNSRDRSSSRDRGSNSRQRRDEDDDPLRVPGTGNRRPGPRPDWYIACYCDWIILVVYK